MQRTVQNAVTYNEGDTVWNSFMRCQTISSMGLYLNSSVFF